MKEDTLSYIRDNKEITFEQKIRLVIMLSLPTIMAQVSSIIMQYIDASMVGRLGAGCSASIGLVSTTTWLLGLMKRKRNGLFYSKKEETINSISHGIGIAMEIGRASCRERV